VGDSRKIIANDTRDKGVVPTGLRLFQGGVKGVFNDNYRTHNS